MNYGPQIQDRGSRLACCATTSSEQEILPRQRVRLYKERWDLKRSHIYSHLKALYTSPTRISPLLNLDYSMKPPLASIFRDAFVDILDVTVPPKQAKNGGTMDSDRPEVPESKDALRINEDLADKIQQEWLFKIKRFPEKVITKYGIVIVVLMSLETLLIISKNVRYLGYWESFTTMSEQYREAFRYTSVARVAHLDSASLRSYHLWRGWVVPSFLAASTYVVMSLLTLRHELYHWKPELLEHYYQTTRMSIIGDYIPRSWLMSWFQIYKDKHQNYVAEHIQAQKHRALKDSKEFLKVLRTVAFNILISIFGLLVLWILLLQTKIETQNIIQLPEFFVPPIQGILWYLCNDFFYFYPHWIAHTGPSPNALYYQILPRKLTDALHKSFNQSHKLHHRTKANLGMAAWYCSPQEQVLFNLFPALIGPLLTQLLADAAGVEHVWGTHLVTLYVWLMAASASSVLAHSGYRSRWNDPGKHDLHHERAFNPRTAVNFGTMGVFDRLHGTSSELAQVDTRAWRAQRDRQAALWEASRRTRVPLTEEQMRVVKQPDHGEEWVDRRI